MTIDLESLIKGESLKEGSDTGKGRRRHNLLPDPERRDRRYLIFSVDDHLVEPPDAFAGRFPRRLADRAPASSKLRRSGGVARMTVSYYQTWDSMRWPDYPSRIVGGTPSVLTR